MGGGGGGSSLQKEKGQNPPCHLTGSAPPSHTHMHTHSYTRALALTHPPCC